MDRELTPAELRELLSVYAIDAVDDDERVAVEAHLESDADARAEVIGLQRVASFLSYVGGPPPAGVWERLESVIRDSPKPAGAVPAPRLVPLARPAEPRRRDRSWRWLAAAAAIVAVAFFALWVVDRGGSGPELDVAASARVANTAAGAQHAVLRADDGTALARAVVLPDGTGYLTSIDLPELDADRTYQLWGVGDPDTVSLGVMGRDPGVIAFHAANMPSALAITNERAGGVVSSDEAPTAVGALRS